MSDGEALLVVLAFLYLSDCFSWLKKGSLAVGSAGGRRYRINSGTGILNNAHGSLLPLNPLPPFGRLFITHPIPISISADGICATNLHSTGQGANPGSAVTALAFEQITAVSADGVLLHINNLRFAKCGSPAQALALAALIKTAKNAKPHKREVLIREFLASSFSKKDAASRLQVARPHLVQLAILGTAFFLFLFLAIPWMAIRTSASTVLIRGAIGAVLLAATIGAFYYHAHARLFPSERFERISSVIKMVLCPPMAIQAVNHLAIPLLAGFHPLVVISLLQPRNAQPFLEGFLRRERFATSTSMDQPAAVGICRPFTQLQSEMVSRFVKENYPALLKTSFAPPSKEGTAAAYCPRCLSQYESPATDCPDCPGVKLVPFGTSAKPAS